MKHLRVFSPFLASLLAVSSAAAQSSDGLTSNDVPDHNQIVAARSQYLQPADVSPESTDDKTLAQFPRRGPMMPMPPRRGYSRGYYRGAYASPWVGADAGHALIGGAIGFGIGATVGAIHSASNHTPVGGGAIIGGAIFGFIGACVGASVGEFQGVPHPFLHHRRFYPPSWPEDDEEGSLRSRSKAKERLAEALPPARPVSPSAPASGEAMAVASPQMARVP
jgi:hypothetical protein